MVYGVRVRLISGALIYFISSLGGISIVKLLNYEFCYQSWLSLALLSRSTWVLSCPLHLFLQYREGTWIGISWVQLRLYALIAIGLALVELLNSLSMSILPGSVYALLKGADIGWSMVLSYLVLGKSFTRQQIAAAVLIMTGIGLVFVLASPTSPSNKVPEKPKEEVHRLTDIPVAMAAGLCLLGAFLNALCSVMTEATLKATLKEEEERLLLFQNNDKGPPSKLLLSNAYSMWTTLFSFIILIVPMLFSGAASFVFIHSSCQREEGVDDLELTSTTGATAAATVSLLLLLIGLSRFTERLSKHWICVYDSAMTFSLIQAARRISAVFLLAVLFGEDFSLGMWVGSICCAIGFFMHYWCSLEKMGPRGGTASDRSQEYELVATEKT